MNISVRDVNAKAFQKFKSVAVEKGLSIGTALNQALNEWIKSKHEKKKKLSFLDLKPVDYGPGSENLSTQADEILYGLKK